MESYKTVRTLVTIKELTESGKIQEAYEALSSLQFKKIRSVQDLYRLAALCQQTNHLEDAHRIHMLLYERTGARRALSMLVELSIKLGWLEEAELFLRKYEKQAPRDPKRHLYRFRIYKYMQAPIEDQIDVLERWKLEEYSERYAYELAKLYHKAGEAGKCVQECNDIILWFGEGKYVEWAYMLRAYHTGEVDLETLHQYQEEFGKKAEGSRKEEITPKEEMIQKEELTPKEEITPKEELTPKEESTQKEEMTPKEETKLKTDTQTTESFEEKQTTKTEETETKEAYEDFFDTSAVSEALVRDIEEMTRLSSRSSEAKQEKKSGIKLWEKAQDEKKEPSFSLLSSKEKLAKQMEELPTSYEEEAIRYMQSFLQDQNSKHLVDLKAEPSSKHQPVQGGELSLLLEQRGQTLTDLFGNFARIEDVRKQLVRALDLIFTPNKKGNLLIITGGGQSGKTTLAKRLIKQLYRLGALSTPKAAILKAKKLEDFSLEKNIEALRESCLIVEQAEMLSESSVDVLLSIVRIQEGKALTFLEGDRIALNQCLRDYPQINQRFNNRIHLPEEYKSQELKGFVHDYLREKEYEIDIYADELLEKRIQMMLGGSSSEPIKNSIAIGKEAIQRAEKRAAKRLGEMAMSENVNYENADLMVLHEEDFL